MCQYLITHILKQDMDSDQVTLSQVQFKQMLNPEQLQVSDKFKQASENKNCDILCRYAAGRTGETFLISLIFNTICSILLEMEKVLQQCKIISLVSNFERLKKL